jgi:hypothetical protein
VADPLLLQKKETSVDMQVDPHGHGFIAATSSATWARESRRADGSVSSVLTPGPALRSITVLSATGERATTGPYTSTRNSSR